jgi:HD-like signal output (HDOD) protein
MMNKKQILFVDDDPQIINGLRRMLRKMRDRWELVFAGDPSEALDLLAARRFDVLVTDMQMPGMNGAELLLRVASQYPHVVRIVLSGHASMTPTSKAVRVAHQYLSKPIEADVLKASIERALSAQSVIEREAVKRFVAGCERLPSAPSLYFELQQVVESPQGGAAEMARIVSRDMALSAKLLQLVNSSFFGIGREVTNVEQAVALLGVSRLKALVLAGQISQAFDSPDERVSWIMNAVWDHAIEVAVLAQDLASELKLPATAEDEAFMAGLLHEIGLLLLASQQPDKLALCLEIVRSTGLSLCEVERAQVGATHGEAAAYLLALWGLPVGIIEAVGFHHEIHQLDRVEANATVLVHVADSFSHELHSDYPAHPLAALAERLDRETLAREGLLQSIENWMARQREHRLAQTHSGVTA